MSCWKSPPVRGRGNGLLDPSLADKLHYLRKMLIYRGRMPLPQLDDSYVGAVSPPPHLGESDGGAGSRDLISVIL